MTPNSERVRANGPSQNGTPLVGAEPSPMIRPPRYRRNAHKRGAASRAAALACLGGPIPSADSGASVAAPDVALGSGAGGLLLAPGTTPRDAWIAWLGPTFTDNGSCYFTGTYSDDYGLSHGLMLVRNVHKDFLRFLESFDYQGKFIVGVEKHLYRDVLHLHSILQGPFNDDQIRWVRDWWSVDRGHARALPVTDGCASYVTKYALKGDTESFEWRLS